MHSIKAAKADKRTCSLLDALAIGQAVKRGDAVLLGPVVFHRDTVNVSVYWQPVHGVDEAVLEWHRERLEKAMRRSLQEMEQQPLDSLSAAEVERLGEKYSRYKTILEVLK